MVCSAFFIVSNWYRFVKQYGDEKDDTFCTPDSKSTSVERLRKQQDYDRIETCFYWLTGAAECAADCREANAAKRFVRNALRSGAMRRTEGKVI